MKRYRKFMHWSFGPVMSGLVVWAASDDIVWGIAAALIVAVIVEGILQGAEMILEEMRNAGILPRRVPGEADRQAAPGRDH